ncbi:MAG: hypothetical protein AAB538_02740 [Patescibacteria group bacterium]
MTLQTFVWGTIAGAILGWLVWVAIVAWLDPVQAGSVGFILFFLALFLAVASSTAIAGYGARRLIGGATHPSHHVRPSLRQGILLGVFFDAMLLLQLLRLSRWWLTLILIVLFLCVEFVFLSYDRNTRRVATVEARGSASAG